MEDGHEIRMWKYLKTVDFINTKIITFEINLFLPHIISMKNTKLHDLENEGQGHLKINGTWKLLNGL